MQNQTFLFAPKDPFYELFSKIILKSSSELYFGKKYENASFSGFLKITDKLS